MHFTLEEMYASETAERTGINNVPSDNIKRVITDITIPNMELVRAILGNNSITINSCYRGPTLNRFLNGAQTSAHLQGFAVDFTCKAFGTPEQITRILELSNLKYDQLIYEGTWVHISFAPAMRQQTLTATFSKGKVAYSEFK